VICYATAEEQSLLKSLWRTRKQLRCCSWEQVAEEEEEETNHSAVFWLQKEADAVEDEREAVELNK
jgi:hypothetical protein